MKVNPVLKERLSDNELQILVQDVQEAILNKEISNDIRGVNMTNDEKYVITKATFQDFYETQDVLVSIIQKMADRIEKQDQVLMKFGAALSELIAKDMMGMEGYGQPSVPSVPSVPSEESTGEDLIESEESIPGVETELGEAVESLGEASEKIEESEEALSGMEEPSVPGVPSVPGMGVPSKPEMSPIAMAHDEALFEAGWKAHEAEMKKQAGVEVKPAEFKNAVPRAPATATVQSQQTNQNGGQVMQKNLSDDELGKMTPHELNQWLKENKLF